MKDAEAAAIIDICYAKQIAHNKYLSSILQYYPLTLSYLVIIYGDTHFVSFKRGIRGS
jgi:hypothetical protein